MFVLLLNRGHAAKQGTVKNELVRIKKAYGEKAAHYCRGNFPLLLDSPNLLSDTLKSLVFGANRKEFFTKLLASGQADAFKAMVYERSGFVQAKEEPVTRKPVKELLSEVGYDFFVCKTEKDVAAFKKYYKSGEILCTFNDVSARLNSCHVFWIVRKELANNIDALDSKRMMKRQDEYGTSCCSIQFSKRGGYLSIKNRYNHKVINCDATFSNNLDNIVPGLAAAFHRDFKIETPTTQKLDIEGFVYLNGKYYRYYHEFNGLHYGRYFYQTTNGVRELNPDKQICFEGLLVDLERKTTTYLPAPDCGLSLTFRKVIVHKDESEYNRAPDTAGVLQIFIP